MRRNAVVAVTLAAVVGAAAGGWALGRNVKSSADAAAEADAPPASRITVPVEERTLSSNLIVRGTVRYDEPTPVALAGSVGTGTSSGGAGAGSATVTVAPEQGDTIDDNSTVLEVSGRPVFAVQGDQPMYRPITPGATGDDVKQVEDALVRFGFDPGPVDGIYDAAAQAAVAAWYESKGYAAQGLTTDQQTQLRSLRSAVTAAQQGLTQANKALSDANKPPTESERLQAEVGVRSAQDALTEATRRADDALRQSAADVTSRTQARDAARTALTAATGARDSSAAARTAAADALASAQAQQAANTPNPETGNPWTAQGIASLSQAASTAAAEAAQAVVAHNEATSTLTGAEQALRDAQTAQTRQPETSAASVRSAQDALRLAELSLEQLDAPRDLTAVREGVATASRARDQAEQDLAEYSVTVGVSLPAGEVLFLPTLPVRIDSVKVRRGDAVSGEIMTVTGSRLAVDASVQVADRDLIAEDDVVEVESTDFGIVLGGTISFIDSRPGTKGLDAQHVYVEITPDDSELAQQLNGAPVKITIPVRSTGDEAVLAVPLAAVSASADGSSRVEIELPDGTTRLVKVEPGLAAQGYVQITALEGAAIAEGDRVVVGVGARDGAETDSSNGTTEASVAGQG